MRASCSVVHKVHSGCTYSPARARRSPLFVSLTNGGFHVANRASERTAKGRVTDRLALVIISVAAATAVVIIIDR